MIEAGILAALCDAAAVVDARGEVVAVNAEWLQQPESSGGWPARSSTGESYMQACLDAADRSAEVFATGLRDVLSGAATSFEIEYAVHVADGTRWCLGQIRPIPGMGAALVTHEDITERHTVEENLAHQATHDPLCDLPNRALLVDRLESAIARARRRLEPLAVLFIDVDRFKLINDSLGHEAGDVVLRGVAARLTQNVRQEDTVARFGGDEFVILCEGSTAKEALELAKRFAAAMAEPLPVADRELLMTLSIGIAELDSDEITAESLLRDADAALYEAKDTGRARAVVFSEEAGFRVQQRSRIEQELRLAIEREQFVVRYQPVIDLRAMKVSGAEALVRWRHPERGLLRPAEFIRVAEECGLVASIDRWVMHKACHDLALWERNLGQELSLALNVSAFELVPDLVEELTLATSEARIDPSSICLELSETTLMSMAGMHLRVLDEVRRLGCYLAADDFGTGYSSLSALQRLPVEVVKIDSTFVEGLGLETADSAIVASIMSLASSLGLHVVAEGVETVPQASALLALGCSSVQGHAFAAPMSSEDFLRYARPRHVAPHPRALRGAFDGRGDLRSWLRLEGRRLSNRAHRRFIDEVMAQIGIPTEAP